MRLFELVAIEDDQHNLARLKNAERWIQTRRWYPQGMTFHWKGIDRAWRQNIHALRSLTKRLSTVRARPASRVEMPPVRADNILSQYLGRLRMLPKRKKSGVLTRSNLEGYSFVPRIENGRDYLTVEIETFWIHVFWSMLPNAPVRACERCGRLLPPQTKTGRPSRRRWCNSCRDKRYKDSLDPESLREMWNQQKRAQRQRSIGR